jgi:hypothetical protein
MLLHALSVDPVTRVGYVELLDAAVDSLQQPHVARALALFMHRLHAHCHPLTLATHRDYITTHLHNSLVNGIDVEAAATLGRECITCKTCRNTLDTHKLYGILKYAIMKYDTFNAKSTIDAMIVELLHAATEDQWGNTKELAKIMLEFIQKRIENRTM